MFFLSWSDYLLIMIYNSFSSVKLLIFSDIRPQAPHIFHSARTPPRPSAERPQPHRVAKRPISQCKTAHFRLRNGPFRDAIRAVLQVACSTLIVSDIQKRQNACLLK